MFRIKKASRLLFARGFFLGRSFFIPLNLAGEIHNHTHNQEETNTSQQQREILLKNNDEYESVKNHQQR